MESIVGLSPEGVDSVLGPPVSVGTEGGVPRRIYKEGTVEVAFRSGRAEWITVFPRDVPYRRDAVDVVGLRCPTPAFANGFVIRWERACGMRNVSIFSDTSGIVRYIWVVATTMP